MKILLVNKFLYPNGGSETYVLELGKYLESIGHEVQYFGMADKRNVVGNATNCYTRNMKFHGNYFTKLFYPVKVVYSREARKKIRIVLQEFRPDVVHMNNFNFQLTASIIYEIASRHIPIIYTAHDCQLVCPNHLCMNWKTDAVCEKCFSGGFRQCTKYRCIHGSVFKSFLGTLEAFIYKTLKTYKKIDVILCPSLFMKHMLDTNEDLRNRTRMLRNFVNLNAHTSAGKQDISERYVLYFGRYGKEKGVETLLKACKNLPEISFKFAGKGEFKEKIETLKNVTELGYISGGELETYIKNAAFTICPSECYENCPFTVMESIISKTPVIGANIGGIPELIGDHKNGLLFESGNVDDLIEKIKYLWYNKNVCDTYREKCDETMFDSIEVYSRKLLDIYSEAIEKVNGKDDFCV